MGLIGPPRSETNTWAEMRALRKLRRDYPRDVGGGVLGQIVTLLLPAITAAAQSGNLSVEGIISQVIAGGAGGAILTAIIGAIKNKAAA